MSLTRVALSVALCAASLSANAGSWTLSPRPLTLRSPSPFQICCGNGPVGYLTIGVFGNGVTTATGVDYRYDARYFTATVTTLTPNGFCHAANGVIQAWVMTWDNTPLSSSWQPACRVGLSVRRGTPMGPHSLRIEKLVCGDRSYAYVPCYSDDPNFLINVLP